MPRFRTPMLITLRQKTNAKYNETHQLLRRDHSKSDTARPKRGQPPHKRPFRPRPGHRIHQESHTRHHRDDQPAASQRLAGMG